MDAELQALLAELEQFGKDNDEKHAGDRSKRMLNLESDAAQFITHVTHTSSGNDVNYLDE